MKIWNLGFFVMLAPMLGAQAEPVLLIDNVLNLDDAIVVEGKSTHFYQQVQLELTKDGSFRVINGVEKSLATVSDKSVKLTQTTPVQVALEVSGYMANPCIDLNTAVTRKGRTFYVVVGETPLQTLVACAQVTKPFELEIHLDVRGLPSGDYVVMVNDDSIEFDLD